MDKRSVDTIERVIDISQRKKRKRFYCTSCGKDFTDRIKAMKNATETQYFRCQGCGRYRAADPGMIALAVLMGVRSDDK